jgi:uncharacterized protein (TIGR00251 family)
MVRLSVKVKPGASTDKISVDGANNISIRIKGKPIDGEANAYLIKYLAKEFGLSPALVQLEKGATSRLKRLIINITPEDLNKVLEKYKTSQNFRNHPEIYIKN